MTVAEIIKQRLQHQLLAGSTAQSPAEVVKQLLAVQAQDYLGALWAVGQRLPGSNEQTIEQALANGSIIRTWPMRGTLHFVAAEDARWLVGALARRVIPKTQSIYKSAGLDESVLKKCTRVVTQCLEKESCLTRDELYERLNRSRISTDNTRGLHITGYLAMQGLICFGPRKGKQQTLVLMDEWLRTTKPVTPDEVPSALAMRYFAGHGPATVQDFAWWSSLNLSEARQAIAMTGSQLRSEKFKEELYFTTGDVPDVKSDNNIAREANPAHLLPAFDEFTVAYKERQLLLKRDQHHRTSMEMLSPGIAINGMMMGTWSRSLSKNGVVISLKPFSKLNKSQVSAINRQVKKYARFVGVDDSTMETLPV